MIPARVQKIKLMDLAFNPVQLSVEVLDRWCITLLELVGQKSAMKFVRILHHIKKEGSIIMKQIVIYEQRTRVFHLHLFFGVKNIFAGTNERLHLCVSRWIIFRAKLNRLFYYREPTKFDRAERESTGRKISKIFTATR